MSKIVGDLYAVQKYDADSSEYYKPTPNGDQSDEFPTIPTISSEGDQDRMTSKQRMNETGKLNETLGTARLGKKSFLESAYQENNLRDPGTGWTYP